MPDDLFHEATQIGCEYKLMVFGPKMPGCGPRLCKFVIVGLAETRRERLYRLTHVVRHHRHHRARVNSARQKSSQLNITHKAQSNGLGNQFTQSLDVVVLIMGRPAFGLPTVVEIPVTLRLNTAILESEGMSGWQSENAPERSDGIGYIAEGQKV